jgi:hypothetical protein
LKSEITPQLPIDAKVNTFKTKQISDGVWFCYCNFATGQRISYISNMFPNATNISKASFTIGNQMEY